ncbi:MAG: hypothetical protein HY517_03585, partial [Candidatus Aenigmarchaeota archaeon]|nr:hypothetical protein [Candidatus Aenigmarchaeota archaeon]
MKKNTVETLLFAFLALAIVFSLISFSLVIGMLNRPVPKEETAELQVVRLADSSCRECFKTDSVVQGLKKPNVNVTSDRSIEFSSAEGRLLIEKYQIEKLPTVIVLGNVNSSLVVNLWNQNWNVEMENGTQVSSVYTNVLPPFRDLAED